MIKRYIALAIAFVTIIPFALSQVTIGLAEKQEKGTILQLKNLPNVEDGSENSTKGLLLPRVRLTDVNNLYPMFENASGSGANSYYNTPDLKAEEDKKHIGLTVYNVALTDKFCPGLHVWMGEEWESFSTYKCFKIAIEQDEVVYNVNDNPTTTNYIDVSWAPKGSTVTLSHEATKNGGLPNISFPTSITDPSGTKKVAITATSMTNTEIKTNPIVDRESKITAKITLGSTTKEASVLLKQSNYGLVAYPSSYYIMDGTTKQLLVKSSDSWTVKIKNNPNNALTLVTTSGEGNTTTGENIQFNLVDDLTDPQIFLSNVVLTFSSTNGKFADVDVPLRCGSYYYVPETKLLVAWTDLTGSKNQVDASRMCAYQSLRLPTVIELQSMYRYFSNNEGASINLTGFLFFATGHSGYWSSDKELVKQGKETNLYPVQVNMLSGSKYASLFTKGGVRCVKTHPNPPTP